MNKVKVIGCGPGYRKLMTLEALEAVERSEIIFGAKRLLNNFPDFRGEKIEIKRNYSWILEKIENEYKTKDISVLVSGDVCFYSFSRLVINRVGRDNCIFYPGVSSVQYAFSKLMIEWSDALFLSFHGRDKKNIENKNLEKILKENNKIAILTGGKKGINDFFSQFKKKVFNDKKIFIMENLSYPNLERVSSVTYDEALHGNFSPLSIVIVLDRELL